MAISLLPPEYRKSSARILRLLQTISKTIYVLFALYFLCLLVIGCLFIYNWQRQNKLLVKKDQYEKQITALRESEIALLIVKDRVTSITKINQPRFSFRRALDKVFAIVQKTGVSVVGLNNKENTITFSVVGTDSFEIEELIKSIRNSEGKYKATMENFSRMKDGTYTASFILQI